MEIKIYREHTENSCTLADLSPGEVFTNHHGATFSTDVYMKIRKNNDFNCVRMTDGALFYLREDFAVAKAEYEFTVKGIRK